MNRRIAKGFDILAPYYDVMAQLVIGKSIVNAQLHFIKRFKKCSHLLILGGGSGWLLDSIFRECPEIKIDYVELSPGMINKARKRIGDNESINFILGTEDDIPDQLYDGVITNFYFDMFDEKGLPVVIEKIKNTLTDSALWVVTDFVNRRKTDGVMLWLMYRFFRIIAHIEANQLTDWQGEMIRAKCQRLEAMKFKDGFILTSLYQSG
jgi:ubiquinone/menaquinone biosynthesis C-methylase UbiE